MKQPKFDVALKLFFLYNHVFTDFNCPCVRFFHSNFLHDYYESMCIKVNGRVLGTGIQRFFYSDWFHVTAGTKCTAPPKVYTVSDSLYLVPILTGYESRLQFYVPASKSTGRRSWLPYR